MKKIIMIMILAMVVVLTGCGDSQPSLDRRNRYQTVMDVKRHVLSDEIISLENLVGLEKTLDSLKEFNINVTFKGDIEKYEKSETAYEDFHTRRIINNLKEKRIKGN